MHKKKKKPFGYAMYHKAWQGKEVTFNIRRTDRQQPITTLYEGGFNIRDEGLIIYSTGRSQKNIRVESILSVKSLSEKGTTSGSTEMMFGNTSST